MFSLSLSLAIIHFLLVPSRPHRTFVTGRKVQIPINEASEKTSEATFF